MNVCNEPRIPGTGQAHLNRYAFAPLTKQCLPFIYTGLGGNENNFLSRASCEATCPGLFIHLFLFCFFFLAFKN